MTPVDVLKAAAVPLGIIAVIYLMYLRDLRRERREAERQARYRARMQARYDEMEFQVGPLVYDQENEAA